MYSRGDDSPIDVFAAGETGRPYGRYAYVKSEHIAISEILAWLVPILKAFHAFHCSVYLHQKKRNDINSFPYHPSLKDVDRWIAKEGFEEVRLINYLCIRSMIADREARLHVRIRPSSCWLDDSRTLQLSLQ